MLQLRKRGNPHRLPKSHKRRQLTPTTCRQQRAPVPLRSLSAPSLAVQPVDPVERARLTLHSADPITGKEDTLYSLFYEFYRGYTIYSTCEGRCCIHGKHGCIKLRGKFVCFPGIEDAKTLIKWFRREGYTSSDSAQRSVPESEYLCLNRRDLPHSLLTSHPMQHVS